MTAGVQLKTVLPSPPAVPFVGKLVGIAYSFN